MADVFTNFLQAFADMPIRILYGKQKGIDDLVIIIGTHDATLHVKYEKSWSPTHGAIHQGYGIISAANTRLSKEQFDALNELGKELRTMAFTETADSLIKVAINAEPKRRCIYVKHEYNHLVTIKA